MTGDRGYFTDKGGPRGLVLRPLYISVALQGPGGRLLLNLVGGLVRP